MIIRVKFHDLETAKTLESSVGGVTVFSPDCGVTTDYAKYAKVIVDTDDEPDVLKTSIAAVGLTVCEVEPRITIADGPNRLHDAARHALASNFYFIAMADRGSFVFSRKDHYDAENRIDGSFMGDAQLEAALPVGFTNSAEPEWYVGECEVNDDAWIGAYLDLIAAGFTELRHNYKTKKYEPKDVEAVRKAAELFYFFALTKYDSPCFMVTTKKSWEEEGEIDDGYNWTDENPFSIARPDGVHNASEHEWDYKDSRDKMRDFKIGRRLFLAAGFTELPQSEVP